MIFIKSINEWKVKEAHKLKMMTKKKRFLSLIWTLWLGHHQKDLRRLGYKPQLNKDWEQKSPMELR